MIQRSAKTAALCVLAIAMLPGTGLGQAITQQPAITFTFTSLDYPGATVTTASGINNSNVIVGDYTDASGNMHGYYRSFSGTFVAVNYPGATATSLWGINDNNQAVGYYTDSSGNTHGFFFGLPGTYIAINYPGAAFTIAYGINNSDQIVGTWGNAAGTIQDGFSLINNVFTDLSYPGSISTLSSGVNSSGTICGEWFDTNSVTHGFKLTAAIGGTYTAINAPGAAETGCDRINDKLEIVGYTQFQRSSEWHGRVFAPESICHPQLPQSDVHSRSRDE